MKYLSQIAILSMLMFSAAHAGETRYRYLDQTPGIVANRLAPQQTIKLKNCGGFGHYRFYSSLDSRIEIQDTSCTSIKVNGKVFSIDKVDPYGQRSVDINFNEMPSGDMGILVGSKSFVESNGKTGKGDHFSVIGQANPFELEFDENNPVEIKLQNCLGTLKASKKNGRVIVDIKDTGCSKFNITSNRMEGVRYEMKSIPEISYEKGHSGSFTLPQEMIKPGMNSIVIWVQSPRLATDVYVLRVEGDK